MAGLVVPVVALAAAGALGGVLWDWWAEPASYLVTRTSTYMDEEQLGRLFAVEARFAVVGVVGGFAVAAVLALLLCRVGSLLALGLLLGAAAGSALAYTVGVSLGPDEPSPGQRFAPGELVPAALSVDSYGLFCSWGIGALAGLLVVASVTGRDQVKNENARFEALLRR